jgi:3-oxoacyl-[acyl-carrier-protein] synthase-3
MPDYAEITGWGKCLPPAVLTNDDIAGIIDTSDEWIRTRSGIEERRVSHVPGGDLAAVAGLRAVAAAGLDIEEIDLLLLATSSPDTVIPSTASQVQRKTGARNAAVMDIVAGCSGFIYSLVVASAMIRAGTANRVLVIGSERLSWFLNWSLRDTAVLFGDGAGAVVVEASNGDSGLLGSHLACDGDALGALVIPDFGTAGNRFQADYGHFGVDFDGREIFRRAVKGMSVEIQHVLSDLAMKKEDIDLLIPHQANLRILESLARHLAIDMSRVVVNIQKYGNTSAATIPIALCDSLASGRISQGDNILMAAFGAGLTQAACMVRWGSRVIPIDQSDASLEPCNLSALEILEEAIRQTGP